MVLKGGEQGFEKRVMTKILYLARVNVTEPKEVLNIGFLSHFTFLKTLFPSFLHHFCLQFLYPTKFLVKECFSLLVELQWPKFLLRVHILIACILRFFTLQ